MCTKPPPLISILVNSISRSKKACQIFPSYSYLDYEWENKMYVQQPTFQNSYKQVAFAGIAFV
jgi:hypothetical protein